MPFVYINMCDLADLADLDRLPSSRQRSLTCKGLEGGKWHQ